MLHDLRRRTTTVFSRILEQLTQLMVRQAFPDHRYLGRREVPVGSARGHVRSGKIVILVTGAAFDGTHSFSVRPAMNLHRVAMAVVTLPRKISGGVAIHTSRMAQHGDYRFESLGRAGIGMSACFMNELCGATFNA